MKLMDTYVNKRQERIQIYGWLHFWKFNFEGSIQLSTMEITIFPPWLNTPSTEVRLVWTARTFSPIVNEVKQCFPVTLKFITQFVSICCQLHRRIRLNLFVLYFWLKDFWNICNVLVVKQRKLNAVVYIFLSVLFHTYFWPTCFMDFFTYLHCTTYHCWRTCPASNPSLLCVLCSQWLTRPSRVRVN